MAIPPPAPPEMTQISGSTNIKEVGHDGDHLWVRFMSGKLYRFPDTPVMHFVGIKASRSPGGYFAAHVRPHHQGSEVKEAV